MGNNILEAKPGRYAMVHVGNTWQHLNNSIKARKFNDFRAKGEDKYCFSFV